MVITRVARSLSLRVHNGRFAGTAPRLLSSLHGRNDNSFLPYTVRYRVKLISGVSLFATYDTEYQEYEIARERFGDDESGGNVNRVGDWPDVRGTRRKLFQTKIVSHDGGEAD